MRAAPPLTVAIGRRSRKLGDHCCLAHHMRYGVGGSSRADLPVCNATPPAHVEVPPVPVHRQTMAIPQARRSLLPAEPHALRRKLCRCVALPRAAAAAELQTLKYHRYRRRQTMAMKSADCQLDKVPRKSWIYALRCRSTDVDAVLAGVAGDIDASRMISRLSIPSKSHCGSAQPCFVTRGSKHTRLIPTLVVSPGGVSSLIACCVADYVPMSDRFDREQLVPLPRYVTHATAGQSYHSRQGIRLPKIRLVSKLKAFWTGFGSIGPHTSWRSVG